jgi:hypothetical protein
MTTDWTTKTRRAIAEDYRSSLPKSIKLNGIPRLPVPPCLCVRIFENRGL